MIVKFTSHTAGFFNHLLKLVWLVELNIHASPGLLDLYDEANVRDLKKEKKTREPVEVPDDISNPSIPVQRPKVKSKKPTGVYSVKIL